MKRDVPGLLDGLTKRDGGTPRQAGMMPVPEHDELTWEVPQPHSGRSGMRRFDGRTRSILTVAAAVAIVVNAGVAWAYWRITESDTEKGSAGATVEMTVRGRSDLNRPLESGAAGNLTVTVQNDLPCAIRITSVRGAAGRAVADDEHRDAGCKDPVVSLSQPSFDVQWDVEKNTLGVFTIENALTTAPGAARACLGANYTIPVQVGGYGQGR